MRSIMLSSGVSLIGAQNANTYNYIQIAGFALGSNIVSQQNMELWDQDEPANLSDMVGDVVYSSDSSNIQYSQLGVDQVKLTCFVSEEVPQVQFGNVVIFAEFMGTVAPLFFCSASFSFIKLQAGKSAFGYRFYFDMVFSLPNLQTRLSLENLTLSAPQFLEVSDEQRLLFPEIEGPDQLFVDRHNLTNTPEFVINSENMHFGVKGTRSYSSNSENLLTFGSVGDNYLF